MKKTHYNITIRNDDTRFFALENLNQIYGLLTGCVPSFQHTFTSFRHFQTWWRKRGKQTKKKTCTLGDGQKLVEFVVEYRY